MIGPDGHGWIGRDKNGNRIYMSDAELEAERRQDEADKRRSQQLYVSDEYKVFFLTKQAGPGNRRGEDRMAYISVKPFSEIPAEAFDKMKAGAEPWNASASQVRIEVKNPLLVFRDDITETESTIYIGELDPDVRRKLRGGNGAENAWDDLFNKASAANPAAVVTVKDDIPVNRPISFKRSPVL